MISHDRKIVCRNFALHYFSKTNNIRNWLSVFLMLYVDINFVPCFMIGTRHMCCSKIVYSTTSFKYLENQNYCRLATLSASIYFVIVNFSLSGMTQ
jgi:hypothetical protein